MATKKTTKKDNQTLALIIVGLLLTVFGITRSAFKGGKFTCANYIANTYMYIILGILIVCTTVEGLGYSDFKGLGGPSSILIIFATFGALIGVLMTDPKNMLVRHVLWIGFVILIGITLFPLVQDMQSSGTLTTALITTLTITVGIAVFSYAYPNKKISRNWGSYLFTGLIVLLFLQIFNLILGTEEWSWVSYFAVFLFCALLLYDTERLNLIAKACREGTKSPSPPDYLRDSLNIFLDIINLFTRMR